MGTIDTTITLAIDSSSVTLTSGKRRKKKGKVIKFNRNITVLVIAKTKSG